VRLVLRRRCPFGEADLCLEGFLVTISGWIHQPTSNTSLPATFGSSMTWMIAIAPRERRLSKRTP